ncbi:MAG TPA: acyltransferase family protein [Hyphomonadaceae bacterium]|nr:acyltransferase family protein [Hyphomonadaceae bacterium]
MRAIPETPPASAVQTASAPSRAYRADVDGLRAIAVLGVLLFHAGYSAFGGGYVGVDIFFVISGFVIASSIGRELSDGGFTLSGFYERRARRILPALTVALLATLAVALWLAPPAYFEPFAKSLAYAGSFLSNVHFWRETGYFTSDSPFQPLLHTWSLGVEEQYYLLAPVLLMAIYHLLGRRWSLGIGPLLVLSFAVSVYQVGRGHFDTAFYLLPARVWELLLGASIALAPPPPLRRIANEILSVTALAMMAAPIILYDRATPFPGLAALTPCLGAAMLIYVGLSPQPPTVSRILSWRPLVYIGLISYSLYLVHWPLFILARFALGRELTFAESLTGLAACLVLAMAMYLLVERPLRRITLSRAHVFALSAAAIIATVGAGLLSPAVNRAIFAGSPVGSTTDWSTVEAAYRTGKCLLFTGQSPDDWNAANCTRAGKEGEAVLLFGDSFAAHYAPGLEAAASEIDDRVLQYSMEGCAPVIDNQREPQSACRDFVSKVFSVIEREHVRRVIIAGSWLEYGPRWSLGVERTLKAFRDLGLEVTLIGQSPNFYLAPAVLVARRGPDDGKDALIDIGDRAARFNATLKDLAARYGAAFIDPVAVLCQGTLCPVRIQGREQFVDYGHFTEAGSVTAVKAYFLDLVRRRSPGSPG